MKAYIEKLLSGGYIKEDGEPVKCRACDKTRLEKYSRSTEEGYEVEYNVRCTGCGKHAGNWAYGYWGV